MARMPVWWRTYVAFSHKPDSLAAQVQFRNRTRRSRESFELFLMALRKLALVAYAAKPSRIDSVVKEQFLLGLNATIQEHITCEEHSSSVALLIRAQRVRDSFDILSSSRHTGSTLVSTVHVPRLWVRNKPHSERHGTKGRHRVSSWNAFIASRRVTCGDAVPGLYRRTRLRNTCNQSRRGAVHN